MQSVSTGLSNFLSGLDASAAKALKASQNNRRFAAAVARVWEDNPLAGDFVLAHVNSLYFTKDEAPRKGAGKNADRYVLGLYMDDSTARAELNARRETLALCLMQDGFSFDEIRILPSRMGMKERRAFPDAKKRVEAVLSGKDPQALREGEDGVDDGAKRADGGNTAGTRLLEADESRLLEVFKRAVCLAMKDLDYASAFLARVEGASLEERYADGKRRSGRARYACKLYATSSKAVSDVVRVFAPSIIAHAKELGLLLVGIDVAQSPAEINGQRAFPAAGSPRPYHAPASL